MRYTNSQYTSNRSSTSLVDRQMLIETTMRYHYTVKWLKRTDSNKFWQLELTYIAGGNATCFKAIL